jgi:hypothetical protein
MLLASGSLLGYDTPAMGDIENRLWDYALKEFNIMAHAPVLSLVIAALSCLATWKVFQAFHHRHLAIIEAQRDHYKALSEAIGMPHIVDAKQRSAKIENLAMLIGEGKDIRHRYHLQPSWNAEWGSWQVKVEDFLHKEMGPQAITKFSNDVGLPQFVVASGLGVGTAHPWIDRQIENLMDIMGQIDAYL